jgi:hypothetical protein
MRLPRKSSDRLSGHSADWIGQGGRNALKNQEEIGGMNLRIRAGRRAGAAFLAIAVTAGGLPAQAGAATKPGLGARRDVAVVSARDAWAVGPQRLDSRR